MDATISLDALFWICAGIASIYGVYKIIRRPFQRLDNHEERITHLEKMSEERKDTDILILKSLNAITNHMIDGNGIKQLKEVRDEFQNSVIIHHK